MSDYLTRLASRTIGTPEIRPRVQPLFSSGVGNAAGGRMEETVESWTDPPEPDELESDLVERFEPRPAPHRRSRVKGREHEPPEQPDATEPAPPEEPAASGKRSKQALRSATPVPQVNDDLQPPPRTIAPVHSAPVEPRKQSTPVPPSSGDTAVLAPVAALRPRAPSPEAATARPPASPPLPAASREDAVGAAATPGARVPLAPPPPSVTRSDTIPSRPINNSPRGTIAPLRTVREDRSPEMPARTRDLTEPLESRREPVERKAMRDFPPEFESSSRPFAEHTVQVTIGRLEIRAAVTPAPTAARRPDVASKTASLEEYLRGRAKAGRK